MTLASRQLPRAVRYTAKSSRNRQAAATSGGCGGASSPRCSKQQQTVGGGTDARAVVVESQEQGSACSPRVLQQTSSSSNGSVAAVAADAAVGSSGPRTPSGGQQRGGGRRHVDLCMWKVQEEISRVRRYDAMNDNDPIKMLVDEVSRFVKLFRESTCDPFWRRKSEKVVLAVLMIRWNGELEFFRGINSEISLPVGSNCAERSAISAALSAHLEISRKHFLAVAVVDPDNGSRHLNPIAPCGVCDEWVKKIQEESADFTIVSFDDAELGAVIERFPLLRCDDRWLSSKPAKLTGSWQCEVCGCKFNPRRALLCAKCQGPRYAGSRRGMREDEGASTGTRGGIGNRISGRAAPPEDDEGSDGEDGLSSGDRGELRLVIKPATTSPCALLPAEDIRSSFPAMTESAEKLSESCGAWSGECERRTRRKSWHPAHGPRQQRLSTAEGGEIIRASSRIAVTARDHHRRGKGDGGGWLYSSESPVQLQREDLYREDCQDCGSDGREDETKDMNEEEGATGDPIACRHHHGDPSSV